MIDGKFDVVFRGQIVKGRELNEVKSNLVQLFKSSLSAVEPLFSGADIKIKKSLDYTTAMKYQSALKQAGALAIINEVQEVKPKANFLMDEEEVNESSHSKSNDTPIEASSPLNPSTTEDSVAVSRESNAIEGEMTMAAVGAQILPDKVYEKREVDTSDLSLADAGERILPPKAPEKHPQPSIDHLSLE